MGKKKFYTLSFTWGIIMTVIGLIVAVALLFMGKKPQRIGYCYMFKIGRGWGGLNLGVVILTSETAILTTFIHEHGHALQNCKYGLLYPFIIALPSVIRYHYRNWREKHGKQNKSDYDDIWFEAEATAIGTHFFAFEYNG